MMGKVGMMTVCSEGLSAGDVVARNKNQDSPKRRYLDVANNEIAARISVQTHN